MHRIPVVHLSLWRVFVVLTVSLQLRLPSTVQQPAQPYYLVRKAVVAAVYSMCRQVNSEVPRDLRMNNNGQFKMGCFLSPLYPQNKYYLTCFMCSDMLKYLGHLPLIKDKACSQTERAQQAGQKASHSLHCCGTLINPLIFSAKRTMLANCQALI